MTQEQASERDKSWERINALMKKYAEENSLGSEKLDEMDYLIKALIYGTVVHLEGEDFEMCEKKIAFIKKELIRIVGNA